MRLRGHITFPLKPHRRHWKRGVKQKVLNSPGLEHRKRKVKASENETSQKQIMLEFINVFTEHFLRTYNSSQHCSQKLSWAQAIQRDATSTLKEFIIKWENWTNQWSRYFLMITLVNGALQAQKRDR